MIKICIVVALFAVFSASSVFAQKQFEKDLIKTSASDLVITFIGHGTLMFSFDGKIIHVDPFGKLTDYAQMPKADLILITHAHSDHLDPSALVHIQSDETPVVIAEVCVDRLADGIVMKNGDAETVQGLSVEAVSAYNLVHKRDDGNPFHPKGEGNGYVITFGETRVYVAGDTENIPEMKALENIDIAFLPMNLPYTMTPEMVADAANAFRPKVLYPYHYGKTDTSELVSLLENEGTIEVRIRQLQ